MERSRASPAPGRGTRFAVGTGIDHRPASDFGHYVELRMLPSPASPGGSRTPNTDGRTLVSARLILMRGSSSSAPLPCSSGPGKHDLGLGSPAVPVWLIAPCSRYGLGGVAAGTVGA